MSQPQKQKKTFSLHDLEDIRPESANQQKLFDHRDTPIKTATGVAGTGKTLVSLYLAFLDVLDKNTNYRQVKIIRSAVPTRDLGFLPGSEQEKVEVYEQPYRDLCDVLFKYQSKNYDNLKEVGYLSFATTSHLRGLTFDESIIVVDEFSSMTFQELDTIITRVGVDSKIIFCGDVSQTDLINRRDRPGYYEFMKVLNRMSNHVNIDFTSEDIVRGDLVAEYLTAKEVNNE